MGNNLRITNALGLLPSVKNPEYQTPVVFSVGGLDGRRGGSRALAVTILPLTTVPERADLRMMERADDEIHRVLPLSNPISCGENLSQGDYSKGGVHETQNGLSHVGDLVSGIPGRNRGIGSLLHRFATGYEDPMLMEAGLPSVIGRRGGNTIDARSISFEDQVQYVPIEHN
ncbi:hypothetical protein NE237_021205 [Protea cynaroides]|uniref:Uncharacterized protein n=1 Tax=Protea cynaroides TaxID=273540 RepID=A0A9Q0K454_9MAGN|nr:hypothetical protein NE237_021205 [Protea cynaroides]